MIDLTDVNKLDRLPAGTLLMQESFDSPKLGAFVRYDRQMDKVILMGSDGSLILCFRAQVRELTPEELIAWHRIHSNR